LALENGHVTNLEVVIASRLEPKFRCSVAVAYTKLKLDCNNKMKMSERAHTCARPLFCCRDTDINPMTLKLKGDVDILKK